VFVYNSRFVAGKKSRASSSSWSDDDSDSNDAAATSSRDVTSSRRAAQGGGGLLPSLHQLSHGVNADPVAARADLETFDVYYVLPSSSARHRRGHLGPPVWTRQQTWDPSLTERRRPNTNCLLDAVPPTPTCCNERRAATLPASIVDNFVSIRIVTYCHFDTAARETRVGLYSATVRCCLDLAPSVMCDRVHYGWLLCLQ